MQHVRTAAVAGFEKMVEQLGGDFENICALSNVAPQTFSQENYDKYISLEKLGQLLFNAAIATNCYHIGLVLGLNKKSSALGILGLIVRDTPDVKSALYALMNNLYIHAQDSVTSNFQYNDTEVTLAIEPTLAQGKHNHHIADLVLGCSLGLLKSLCGEDFKPIEVRLGTRNQHSLGQYKRLLNTSVKINQGRNEIIFARELLDIKLEEIDPQYHALIQSHVKHDTSDQNYSVRVSNVIRNVLSETKCNSDYVAEQFSLNKRTLNRKLALEGTTFKDLVVQIKKEEAQKLLSNTSNSITHVAFELGYAEASSFTSAYKAWFGITPKKWQQQQPEKSDTK